MRIYERDGVKYVETGEVRCANYGEVFFNSVGCTQECCGRGTLGSYKILRPATPEEVAESLGFYDSSKKLPLTLPLVEGQIVICRDGVERTVEYMTLGGRGVRLSGVSGVYSATGLGNHDVPGAVCTEPCREDAISDSPRWKPEKKDEQEKQARAAETVGVKGSHPNPTGLTGSNPQSKTLPSGTGGVPCTGDSKDKPAAPPAILDFNKCACCGGAGRVSGVRRIPPTRALFFGVETTVYGEYHSDSDCPECNAPKPEAPKPDTRPDIVQRDARSEEFVWRRDWRVGR